MCVFRRSLLGLVVGVTAFGVAERKFQFASVGAA
jgi:hypothetical protein